MSACRYGDPTCPCQDGDACHYEGADPSPVVAAGPAAGERVLALRRQMIATQEPTRVSLVVEEPEAPPND